MIPSSPVRLSLALVHRPGAIVLSSSWRIKHNLGWMAAGAPRRAIAGAAHRLAFGCLTYAFVANDFSVTYVTMHSNTALPLHYRVAGVWGGHEGSLLLWALMLGVLDDGGEPLSTHLPEEIVARVLGVMGLVSAGFLAFLLFTSNPFDRLLPPAADGRDLNPLLQESGHGAAPADAVHGLRRLLGRLRLRRRGAAFGQARRHLGALVGPWTTVAWASSPSASRSAAAGPITSSAGAAGGSGTRWKTPRSCPGWWAPR